jgi:hypothetical protein
MKEPSPYGLVELLIAIHTIRKINKAKQMTKRFRAGFLSMLLFFHFLTWGIRKANSSKP